MRLGVFLDYRFRRVGSVLSAERAFALFLFGLARRTGGLTVIARLDPHPEPFPYEAPAEVTLAPLPFYASLGRPRSAARALLRGGFRVWRHLDELDVVWVLGPNPMAVAVATLARLRGRRVVLGVRQDTGTYVRSRHPHRRGMILAGALLDRAFRALARGCPVVAVGEEIAGSYDHAPAVHTLVVSLIAERDVAGDGAPREPRDPVRVLSVGRLDAEKNPLLLADILAELQQEASQRRWRLDVYGDGPQAGALARRLEALGVSEHAALHGYVAAGDGLGAAYRQADVLLHVSWTEGVPQVLIEAFAARLPVVATAVGGVAALAGPAAVLVPPGNARAAAEAVRTVASDRELRERLVRAGTAVAREHTLEQEVDRLARFLVGVAA